MARSQWHSLLYFRATAIVIKCVKSCRRSGQSFRKASRWTESFYELEEEDEMGQTKGDLLCIVWNFAKFGKNYNLVGM